MACFCCQAGEAALSLHSRAAARLPLLLHCLLLQASAAAALTQCHLATAGGHISEMKHLVAAFPTLLRKPLQSACHTLSGTVCSTVCIRLPSLNSKPLRRALGRTTSAERKINLPTSSREG